ncbi:uncharacterized protein B0H18DRAFT_399547 [Fomitopsis serialis]|uniref:uncharacterized protein n=1 Tax=Fomitopsis serialis TaxID=139415 RepID=UPI0020074070|nr:uncharacterized protein B0H18DRAFT_399547 [Neoantrodia serialis]KAH9924708.1 hypothetical protein B0H18DRAFT_399547 [Neoantrodia serialis]
MIHPGQEHGRPIPTHAQPSGESSCASRPMTGSPPSPLPQAIPRPYWASSSSASVDLLGGDGSPERPKAECVTAWHSSPDLMGSFSTGFYRKSGQGDHSDIASAATVSAQSFKSTSFGSLQTTGSPPTVIQRVTALAANPPTVRSTAKTGGLSAQDLMFFEGL